MREIKFRAWDKENKKLISWRDICCYYNLLSMLDPVARDYDRYDVLQYIGLKDKNEREVYKGDIYKDEENMLWEVIFDKEDTSYKLENLHTPGRTTIRSIKDMDHVGNIYENPELLEVQ